MPSYQGNHLLRSRFVTSSSTFDSSFDMLPMAPSFNKSSLVFLLQPLFLFLFFFLLHIEMGLLLHLMGLKTAKDICLSIRCLFINRNRCSCNTTNNLNVSENEECVSQTPQIAIFFPIKPPAAAKQETLCSVSALVLSEIPRYCCWKKNKEK